MLYVNSSQKFEVCFSFIVTTGRAYLAEWNENGRFIFDLFFKIRLFYVEQLHDNHIRKTNEKYDILGIS